MRSWGLCRTWRKVRRPNSLKKKIDRKWNLYNMCASNIWMNALTFHSAWNNWLLFIVSSFENSPPWTLKIGLIFFSANYICITLFSDLKKKIALRDERIASLEVASKNASTTLRQQTESHISELSALREQLQASLVCYDDLWLTSI